MAQARTLHQQPQQTGSCGPGRAWFPSLVQLTLCRVSVPSPHSYQTPALSVLPEAALVWPKPRKPILQRQQRPERPNTGMDTSGQKALSQTLHPGCYGPSGEGATRSHLVWPKSFAGLPGACLVRLGDTSESGQRTGQASCVPRPCGPLPCPLRHQKGRDQPREDWPEAPGWARGGSGYRKCPPRPGSVGHSAASTPTHRRCTRSRQEEASAQRKAAQEAGPPPLPAPSLPPRGSSGTDAILKPPGLCP